MPGSDAEIEIRQLFEAADFGVEFTPELRVQEESIRAQIARTDISTLALRAATTAGSTTLP